MDASGSRPRSISWNGVHALLPVSWEVILKGKNHLIIEQDFSPILEFRWQIHPGAVDEARQRDRILSQLKKETGNDPYLTEPPAFLHTLKSRYNVSAFTFDNEPVPAGTILTCHKSGTLVLIHFFRSTIRSTDNLVFFFNSLTCLSEKEQNDHWSIEDISFKLPDLFALDTFLFSFGLAQLSFSRKAADVTLYRLTRGSKHLAKHSFRELFAAFTGDNPDVYSEINDYTLRLETTPTLKDQLLRTIKRKKVYRRGTFTYYPDHDKILGIHLKSRHSVDQKMLEFIEKYYVLIEEKTTS